MLQQRKGISPANRKQAAIDATNLFAQQSIFESSINIACYVATATEFDATPLIQLIWQQKKKCFVPVLADVQSKQLFFSQYRDGDVLQKNQVNVLEPKNNTHIISPESLDIVIMPLVAFDKLGHRLGTGGGYYDKTFSFIHHAHIRKPLLIGLAFSAQEIDVIPADTWDVPLDGVLTEKELMLFSH